MKLKIDPTTDGLGTLHCQIYVRAYTDSGVAKTVTLNELTRESLLEYARKEGLEKVLLHTFGHY